MKIIIMQKVSIIIPVYNVASYIEESLLSALNQTYSNIEYIIVDDCGTDNSISIVRMLQHSNPYKDIKIIHHTQNRGLSAARNTGLINATGEYIYFMDSDDTISRDCIEKHLNAILMYDADFTDANVRVIGGRQKLFNTIKSISLIETSDIMVGCTIGDIHITACNKLYNKNFLIKNDILFLEGLIYEDVMWTFDIAQNARKVVVIPDFTYHYLIRDGSTTTNVSTKQIIKRYDSWIYVINHIIQIAKTLPNKKTQISIYRWLSKIRFKISARLVSMDIDENIKKKYYGEINSSDIRLYSSGLYSMVCSMPYGIFKSIFNPLYKVFTFIKHRS